MTAYARVLEGTGALATAFLWKTRRVWQLLKTANTVS